MEKNLIVVYESEIGTPFVVKPVGDQVLLLSPGQDLIRLEVDNVNWQSQERTYARNGESKFCYLGMTGEEIKGERMFALLIKAFGADCYNGGNYKDLLDIFSQWGISVRNEPLNVKMHLYKREKAGLTEYHFMGEGFNDYLCSNCVEMSSYLGDTLQLIALTGLFSEINIEVSQGSFTTDEFVATEIRLSEMLKDEKSISLTFKKEVE